MTPRPFAALLVALTLSGCSFVGARQYEENIQDFDGDGAIAERFGGEDCADDDPTITDCDVDDDGVRSIAAGGADCDDDDPAIYPGAAEICDEIDNDCDGLVDDLDVDIQSAERPTWYRDADQDGYGNPDDTAEACAAPVGYIADAGDCDDSRGDVSPGANEFCDPVDHDCNGDPTANAVDQVGLYVDGDGDGFGRDELANVAACPGTAPSGTSEKNTDCDDNSAAVFPGAAETWYDGIDGDCAGDSDFDQDGDGALYPDEDCDDTDPTLSPAARELCDGIDNDCDGSTDEVEDVAPFELTYYYADLDGDGAGGGAPIASCSPAIPANFVATGGDCDDGNPAVNPGGTEVCDGADNDCNGFVDDHPSNPQTFYVDGDGDGFGEVAVEGCALADGWSTRAGDCNDGDPGVYPGAFEICGDANIQDCDRTAPLFDCDGDGVDGAYPGNNQAGADCDDGNRITYPNALEICDGADNDCDGSIDNPPTEPVSVISYYADRDGDGFGAGPQLFPQTCEDAVGMVTNNDDCNDLNAAVHPGAPEICDGVDNDCDSQVDSGLVAEPRVFYLDADGDGAGDPGVAYAQSCAAPTDGRVWVDLGTDCDDADADIGPHADEICDGIDNDCDGRTDDQDTDTIGASWYADTDADGYGAGAPVSACAQPTGFVDNRDDCDDTRNDINPGVAEECDGYDNDCDGFIDAADDAVTTSLLWYPDVDADGYGDASATPVPDCVAPVNHVANNLDCDDAAASVSPAATEVCDGQDNDCDSFVDDADSFVVGGQIWYQDADQDGVGGSATVFACAQPVDGRGVPTAVAIRGDCDDSDPARYPGNLEVCDGIDGDCDGVADVDEPIAPVGSTDAWTDGDGDGYGTGPRLEICLVARAVLTTGYADVDGDCDDADPNVHPGIAAEQCSGGVGLDLDCDGLFGTDDPDYDGTGGFTYGQDVDGDGFGSPLYTVDSCAAAAPAGYTADTTDCNDLDERTYPGMPWYADLDGDGFGDPDNAVNSAAGSCAAPGPGYTTDARDCNDGNSAVRPFAPELCDGIDNDCDGLTDDEDAVVDGRSEYFEDKDEDGWGDPATRVATCENTAPPATGGPWVEEGFDCDDNDPTRNPTAMETCNDGLDADCNGDDNTAFNDQAPIADAVTYYLDEDGDGVFAPSGFDSCTAPTTPYATVAGGDCDDFEASVYPGAAEACGDSLDNDCDNAVDEAASVRWASTWGGIQDEGVATHPVVDGQGNIYVGASTGSTTVDGVSYTFPRFGSVVVARDAVGAARWVTTISALSTGDGVLDRMMLHPQNGDLILVGHGFGDALAINGASEAALTGCCQWMWVAALDPTTGAPKWAQSFGSATGGSSWGRGVAVDPSSGEIVVAGHMQGEVDFAGTLLATSGNSDVDGVVVRLDPTGSVTSAYRFGSSLAVEQAEDIAVDPAGFDVVVGQYDQADADVGGVTLQWSDRADAFVALIDSGSSDTAIAVTAAAIAGPNREIIHDVELGPTGAIYLAGTYQWGATAFAPTVIGPNSLVLDSSSYGLFLAKLAPQSVDLAWATGTTGGGGSSNELARIAVDADDQVFMAFQYADTATTQFGNWFIDTGATARAKLAHVDGASGQTMWVDDYGTATEIGFTGIALAPSGERVVSGHHSAAQSLPGAALSLAGGTDQFVVALRQNLFRDIDGDGFGAGTAVTSCEPSPAGFSLLATDCNDFREYAYPGGTEYCHDSFDDDCDGDPDTALIPSALMDSDVYYLDDDGDGFASPDPSYLCAIPTGNYALGPGQDCDDTDANRAPFLTVPIGSAQAVTDLASYLAGPVCEGTILALDAETHAGGVNLQGAVDVQVVGAGVGQTIVDASASGAAYAFDGVGNGVVFQDLTIVHQSGGGARLQPGVAASFTGVDFGDPGTPGSFSSYDGGVLDVPSASVDLTDVRFFNAVGTSGVGGCLAIQDGSATLTDVVLDNCYGDHGAAIHQDGGDFRATRLTIRGSSTTDPMAVPQLWAIDNASVLVEDLQYVGNGGLIGLNAGLSVAEFTRVRAVDNSRGVFEANDATASVAIHNLLSIGNGGDGYPSVAFVATGTLTLDQPTFIRDNQPVVVDNTAADLSNALFVDNFGQMVETNGGTITVLGAMTTGTDIIGVVSDAVAVTQSVTMEFDRYHASLAADRVDAYPIGSWNTNSYGAHHGAFAGWWDYADVNVDVDGDGMPDAWEWIWLGGDALPGDNPDGDGWTNLQEYTGQIGGYGGHPLFADTDGDTANDDVDPFPADPNAP